MKNKLSAFTSSLNRARASAANYRLVGKPASATALPLPRFTSSVTPFWHPNLLDTLRVPLTRRHE